MTERHATLVEASLQYARENREDMARWLAIETLLSDEAALGDDELAARLCALQDRLEAQARKQFGV